MTPEKKEEFAKQITTQLYPLGAVATKMRLDSRGALHIDSKPNTSSSFTDSMRRVARLIRGIDLDEAKDVYLHYEVPAPARD